MEQSEYEYDQSLANFLAAQLDHSGVNRSKKLERLTVICQKYEFLLAEAAGSYPVEDYQDTRQKREILFYDYGFLEGMKFFQSFIVQSPEEMVESLYPEEAGESQNVFRVQEGQVTIRERVIK